MSEAATDPLALAETWLKDAERDSGKRNPLAMAVATTSQAGVPSVRMVLLRRFARAPGFVVFYTHYGSRKGLEITANAQAAAVLYWEELGRQLRFAGPVTRSPEAPNNSCVTVTNGTVWWTSPTRCSLARSRRCCVGPRR